MTRDIRKLFVDDEADEARESELEDDDSQEDDSDFIDDATRDRTSVQPVVDSSPSTSGPAASSSETTHSRHDWLLNLASRYAPQERAPSDAPNSSTASQISTTLSQSADELAHELARQVHPHPTLYIMGILTSEHARRVLADQNLYIVLLYCQPGSKPSTMARIKELHSTHPELQLHNAVPHPSIDGIFLMLDRDFNRNLGNHLSAIPACRRSAFKPDILRSLGRIPPNPVLWGRFPIYISDIPNRVEFLLTLRIRRPPLVKSWVRIPSGLYKGDTGFVVREPFDEEDEARQAEMEEEMATLRASLKTKTEEMQTLWEELDEAKERHVAAVNEKMNELKSRSAIVSSHGPLSEFFGDTQLPEQSFDEASEIVQLREAYEELHRSTIHILNTVVATARALNARIDDLQNKMVTSDPICSILVVPRITPDQCAPSPPRERSNGPLQRKRKRQDGVSRDKHDAASPPRLLPANSFTRSVLDSVGETRVYVGLEHRTFEHDLEVIGLRASSVAKNLADSMPTTLLSLFLGSCHPSMQDIRSDPTVALPVPDHWYFMPGDRCIDKETGRIGTYTAESRSSLSGVEILTEEGLLAVSRSRLHKVIEVGNIVHCKLADGSFVGPGFVVALGEAEKQILATVVLHIIRDGLGLAPKVLTLHVNALRVVPSEWYADKESDLKTLNDKDNENDQGSKVQVEDPYKGFTGGTPWRGRKVYINCEGDPHHKEQAVILDAVLADKGFEWERVRRRSGKTVEYRNGIKLVVQFTMVRAVQARTRSYHYEDVLDWNTRWPLRIACPLSDKQQSFTGPMDVWEAELRQKYPVWKPEDLARRSVWFISTMSRARATVNPSSLDTHDPSFHRQTPPPDANDHTLRGKTPPPLEWPRHMARDPEEEALRDFTRQMLANDPTIPSRPRRPPAPPPGKPHYGSDHWLLNPILKGYRVEVLYREAQSDPLFAPPIIAGVQKKRKTEEAIVGVRVVAMLGDHPDGPHKPPVVYRCAQKTLKPQKQRLIPQSCKPVHPGSRFGRNYRIYAYRGPNAGRFMRPMSHSGSEEELVHSGPLVTPVIGGTDIIMVARELEHSPLSIDDVTIRSLSTILDVDAVLIKDTPLDIQHNHEYERMRAQRLANAKL